MTYLNPFHKGVAERKLHKIEEMVDDDDDIYIVDA